MLRLSCVVVGRYCFLFFLFSLLPHTALAQLETATVSGQVLDPSGLSIAGAQVKLVDIDRDTSTNTSTNNSGLYMFPSVKPGRYRMEVTAAGFKLVNATDLTVNVQDHLEQNFKLAVGSVSESVTVEGGTSLVNTESASVSTVVDRQFAENLPMNGRSFQTLIQLTPGVVVLPSTTYDSGQFSINGQRASSNYWMVDGVSANIGVGVNAVGGAGNALGGGLASFSAQGGTNSLVSVDAMQEFRIQTSTYAPEFGRTPGGQISIVTRSGTNQFHGTAFDYFRNDVLDASDWFNGYINSPPLPKAQERQNDFGGTISGPLLNNRTFFFFSYEGLRLRLPQTLLTTVPDLSARQGAIPAMQPYLNAYPLPNGTDNIPTGIAQSNASFSNSSTLDAYSLRVDHRLTDKLNVFGRYNYSPSEISERGSGGASLSTVTPTRITTQTATLGTAWLISPVTTNDFRFNYSRTDSSSYNYVDNFGGAVPVAPPFPSPYISQNSDFSFSILSLSDFALLQGTNGANLQRQFNLIDSLSAQRRSHALKFGVDFRRLSPVSNGRVYSQAPIFLDVPSAEDGNFFFTIVGSGREARLFFHNVSVFAQDTWRIVPRLTITYGLRWDVDFAPSSTPSLLAVSGYNLSNLSTLALAPVGTPAFRTPYGNVAPRIGVAYELSPSQKWERVLRGGFGMFYDLADQEVGNLISGVGYPFIAQNRLFFGTVPLGAQIAAPPPIIPPGGGAGILNAFDPHLQLPYTLEWNIALEQGVGTQQTVSTSYIGALGRRLIQSAVIVSPNPNFAQAVLVGNSATSDHHALQVQFKRRLSSGLQAVASYTWSHSIDTASAGSYGNGANLLTPGINPNTNRGSSDFDIRNALSAAATYDIPAPKINPMVNAVLGGWSLQNVVQGRSAPPVDVYSSVFSTLLGSQTSVRPDQVAGIPLYLYGSEYPGGKAINNTPGAVVGGCPDGSQSIGPFCNPPTDSNGNPLRQGNLGRNALRGFGAVQWDFAVHRVFSIHESLKLQFRAELFNVLNHPNFGQPVGDLSGFSGPFGLSTQMLGQSLNQNVGGGGFSALYQLGGPRSIQLALKLQF